ncbi:hypothetical protein GCM10010277_11700 [Streptomyces longisporoflavus]|uniref:DUF7144 family membrane protein n=1 Tax=Streptomyces longisporoflavus TaxID=28044 RepID=UPI00167E4C59|nr:hypothetical protein [Streptomyces longisporoflavus]GGV29111.1 hypothetical protein GCM10010277_11700 [Streptomyces longisporoflavus]
MATSTAQHHRSDAKQTAAAGLTIFAGVMLFLSGSLDFCRGLMAVLEDTIFVNTPSYAFEFDLTSWGWIHMIIGTIAVVVSFGLFVAAKWARITGVIIASLVIIANFLSLPYYPIWSITLIAMSGFIIWALCTVDKESVY